MSTDTTTPLATTTTESTTTESTAVVPAVTVTPGDADATAPATAGFGPSTAFRSTFCMPIVQAR